MGEVALICYDTAMIRTRDFAVFLFTVLFLVSGISISVLKGVAVTGGQTAGVYLGGESVAPLGDLIAQPDETTAVDRPGSLASMRAKIAALGAQFGEISPENEVVTAEADPVVGGSATTTDDKDTVTLCANYRTIAPPALGRVAFKEGEGALMVYRTEVAVAQPLVDPSASATASVPPISGLRDVTLLQLPLRTSPLSQSSCIPYDVVGIATDGSYIRNDEQSAYAVFGSDILIGYALDGFPIYGLNKRVTTDSCGGARGFDTYRYYLSDTRDGVLGCFSGVPISL